MCESANNDGKLEWMYKGSGGTVDREEYLLGRAVDKAFEQGDGSSGKGVTEREPVPGPLLGRSSANIAGVEHVDIMRKIHEDPLFAIKKKEIERREQLLKNPVKLKKLQDMLNKQKDDNSNKSGKKKKKKKKKKRKKARDSSEDETSDGGEISGDDIDELLAKKYKKLRTNLRLDDIYNLSEKDDDSSSSDDSKASYLNRKDTSSKNRRNQKHDDNESKGNRKRSPNVYRNDGRKYDESKRYNREDDARYSRKDGKQPAHDSKNDKREYDKRDNTKERYGGGSRRRKRNGSEDGHADDADKQKRSHKCNKETKKRRTTSSTSSSSSSDEEIDSRNKKKVYERGSKKDKKSKERQRKRNSSSSSSSSSSSEEDDSRRDNSKSSKKGGKEKYGKNNLGNTTSNRFALKEGKKDINVKSKPSDKKKHAEQRSPTSSETSSGSGPDEPVEHKKKYGLVLPEGKVYDNLKNTQKRVREETSKVEIKKQFQRPKPVKLSEKEKEERRKEMMKNAEWRDDVRKKNIEKYKDKEAKEKEHQKDYSEDFYRKQLSHAASQGSVEGRIKSNLNRIQRHSSAMDSNFTRR